MTGAEFPEIINYISLCDSQWEGGIGRYTWQWRPCASTTFAAVTPAWSQGRPQALCGLCAVRLQFFSECAAGVSRQRGKVASLNPGRWLDCKNCLTPDCGAVRLAELLTEALRSRSRCSELQLPLSFFPKTTSERPEATASPAEAKNTVMQWRHPSGWHLHASEKKARAALKGFTRRA